MSLWYLIGDTLPAAHAAVRVVLHGVLMLSHSAFFAFTRCSFADLLSVEISKSAFVYKKFCSFSSCFLHCHLHYMITVVGETGKL